MAIGVQVWNKTAATNATADSNINWAEGMAPSQVNDSARAIMASVASWRDDNNGTLITSGSSTALTLVTNQVEAALTSGFTVQFQFGTGASSAATLAVDGLTAKPIQTFPGTGLVGGEYALGAAGSFTYSTTGTGQWIATPTLPVNFFSQPAVVSAPAGTSSASFVMAGLGSSFVYTPVRSTRCFIMMTFFCQSAPAGLSNFQLAVGTGAAPINGAAATGTVISGSISAFSDASGGSLPCTIQGIATGLAIGTAIWIDLQQSNSSAATATAHQCNLTIFEI